MRGSPDALTASSAARCSGESTTSKAAPLSTTCSGLLTPISVDVTPGRPQTQTSAMRVGLPTAARGRSALRAVIVLRNAVVRSRAEQYASSLNFIML